MTTLPNMGLELPPRGPSGSGRWADVVDANTMKSDAHNHQPGKGLPIRSAALQIDGDVSFNSQWAVTALNRVSFAPVPAPAVNRSIWVNAADNELYWTSAAGNDIRLTAGNALNVAQFAGGIGGDYTTVGASAQYEDANKRYTFKQGNGGLLWARLHAGGLRLSPFATTAAAFIEQLAPSGLSTSYTMTWPSALPSTASIAQVDNAGQWSFGAPIGGDITLAANKSVIASGSGAFKHGIITINIPVLGSSRGQVLEFGDFSGSPAQAPATRFFSSATSPGGALWTFALPVGKRIVAIRAKVKDLAASPLTLRFARKTMSALADPVWTNVGGSNSSAGSGANQSLSLGSINYVVEPFTECAVQITRTSGTATDNWLVYVIEVDYDHT